MKIAVLGTGTVGPTLAEKFAALGHDVVIGTRDPEEAKNRMTSDREWVPPFGAWHQDHPDVDVATFSDATADAELVVNATNGAASMDALKAAGSEHLDGKILIEVANPLDFSQGMPPSLFVSNTDSLAEQIQAAFSGARVVKTLNTVTARLMVHPEETAGGDHTMFVAGNDPDAKSQVTTILTDWFGWKDVVDLGDLAGARAMEMVLPLWLRLVMSSGNPMINVKVVR
ncbi:MAG TPA: NAD(P)-binding domain-containing protein [Actinomycetota bacterium]|nr:NAD(P)-binding domain-containing protein [Actinomycetota bacterium]